MHHATFDINFNVASLKTDYAWEKSVQHFFF